MGLTGGNNNNKIEIDAGMVTLRQPLGHERRPEVSYTYVFFEQQHLHSMMATGQEQDLRSTSRDPDATALRASCLVGMHSIV